MSTNDSESDQLLARAPRSWSATILALLILAVPWAVAGCDSGGSGGSGLVSNNQDQEEQNEEEQTEDPANLSEVVVSATGTLIQVGDVVTLSAFALYENGSIEEIDDGVTWTLSDDQVLELAEGPPATATSLATGTCEVTATFEGIASNPFTIDVTGATLENLTLSTSHSSLLVGEQATVTVEAEFSDGSTTDVTQQASLVAGDTDVITVTAGNPTTVTADAAGSSTLVAMLDGTVSNLVSFTVTAPLVTLDSITLSLSDTLLDIGDTATLSATAHYSDGSSDNVTNQVSVSIGNSSYVSVSSNNSTVTALAYGSTTLDAELDNLLSNAVTVTVQDPGSVPTIAPGTGFSGSTPQPPTVGSGPGSDAKAIARFDVAPYQRFTETFGLGVIAFHINEIDRVEFSADGGPWVAVTEMTINPRTNVGEYWANLSAEDCGQGLVEIRAVAYPNVGRPRVLPSLYLFADPDDNAPSIVRYIGPSGSDSSGDGSASNPYRTARKAGRSIQSASGDGTADGGVIYALAGNNILESGGSSVTTRDRYVTIMPAPGLTRSQVNITSGGGGLETKLLRLLNVTVRAGIHSGFSADEITSGDEEGHLLAENCLFQGDGNNTEVGALGFVGETRYTGYYVLDSEIRDERHGLHRAGLLRNVHCYNIGSDPFQNSRFLVNCSVDGIENNSGWHPDVMQWTQTGSNVIIYGVRAINVKGQGIFAKPTTLALHDVALINVMIEESASYKSEWEPNSNHLLIWNCSMIDHTLQWTGTNATNVSIRNNYFDKIVGSIPSSAEIDNNHFRTGTPRGSNSTTGGTTSSIFENPSNGDYAPASGSIIEGPSRPTLIHDPLVPTDALSNLWQLPASIGACEN